MEPIDNIEEWHRIGNKLTKYLKICSCQRKLRSIIDNLWEMHEKNRAAYETGGDRQFTGAEWLVWAMIDANTAGIVDHGINCEYPITYSESEFWEWIKEVKDSPYLQDN